MHKAISSEIKPTLLRTEWPVCIVLVLSVGGSFMEVSILLEALYCSQNVATAIANIGPLLNKLTIMLLSMKIILTHQERYKQ